MKQRYNLYYNHNSESHKVENLTLIGVLAETHTRLTAGAEITSVIRVEDD